MKTIRLKKLTLVLLINSLMHFMNPIACQTINGVVLDSETHEPIMSCHLSLEGSQEIIVTNTFGEFRINNAKNGQTLSISHLNYISKYIPIDKDDTILVINLKQLAHSINTVTLSQTRVSSMDFISESILKFRTKIKNGKYSKALFVTNCTTNQNREYSEFFGNLSQRKGKHKFEFKHGYIDIGSEDLNTTLNLDAALLMLKYNLYSSNNSYLPPSIISFNKRKLKKNYSAKLVEIICDSIYIYNIDPIKESEYNENWVVWIDKFNLELKRIILTIGNNQLLNFSSINTQNKFYIEKLKIDYSYASSRLSSIKQELLLNDDSKSFKQLSELTPYNYQNKFDLPFHTINIPSHDMYTYYLNIPTDTTFWKQQQYISQVDQLTNAEVQKSKRNLKLLLPQRYLSSSEFKHQHTQTKVPRDETGNTIKVKPNSLYVKSLQHLESSIYFNYNCVDGYMNFQLVLIVDMDRTFLLDSRPLISQALEKSNLVAEEFVLALEKELNERNYKCDEISKEELLRIYQEKTSELKFLMSDRDIYQDIDWSGRKIYDQYKNRVKGK